jgi:hypothetical protein
MEFRYAFPYVTKKTVDGAQITSHPGNPLMGLMFGRRGTWTFGGMEFGNLAPGSGMPSSD